MTDITALVENLNPAQREAVTAPLNHSLILAGAGSGKTRVLIHRIAWLVRVETVAPHAILAVTFTNKAARELRDRIHALQVGIDSDMWVGTFHGLAHRLLRLHATDAGLPSGFQIMDSDDQLRLIKRLTRDLGLNEEAWAPKKTQWFINHKKEEGIRAQHLAAKGDPYTATLIKLYAAYDAACQQAGVIDFAEILLRCQELLLSHPALLAHYQQRFKHILIDEFQDTNAVQYAWLRLLGKQACVMAVGDDDQSIYGWRGARIENIQRFNQDFAGAELIRLEQNYRSTGMILGAANALIAHNDERLGKELWTEEVMGDPITIYPAYNEIDEARYIVSRVRSAIAEGISHDEIAVLYRSNAQSRVIEEALIQAGIPYRVYGGLRFFDRAEIKDILAYLRLMTHREDDTAFERIVNHPPRGIGEKTIAVIRETARDHGLSLWQAAEKQITDKVFSPRAENALIAFMENIKSMTKTTTEYPLGEQVAYVVEHSQLIPYYQRQEGDRAQTKTENIEELINACQLFENEPSDELTPLMSLLTHASLEGGDYQADVFENCVQLMTLHMAKGLEFQQVFIAGVEEGLFPHKMALDEPGRLAEERRLCYVGMTRARAHLILTYAECRRHYGTEEYHRPSRFIREIPKEFQSCVRVSSPAASIPPMPAASEECQEGFYLGQIVHHQTFGKGLLINTEGSGARTQVQIDFETHGKKWLMLRYANLTAV